MEMVQGEPTRFGIYYTKYLTVLIIVCSPFRTVILKLGMVEPLNMSKHIVKNLETPFFQIRYQFGTASHVSQ